MYKKHINYKFSSAAIFFIVFGLTACSGGGSKDDPSAEFGESEAFNLENYVNDQVEDNDIVGRWIMIGELTRRLESDGVLDAKVKFREIIDISKENGNYLFHICGASNPIAANYDGSTFGMSGYDRTIELSVINNTAMEGIYVSDESGTNYIEVETGEVSLVKIADNENQTFGSFQLDFEISDSGVTETTGNIFCFTERIDESEGIYEGNNFNETKHYFYFRNFDFSTSVSLLDAQGQLDNNPYLRYEIEVLHRENSSERVILELNKGTFIESNDELSLIFTRPSAESVSASFSGVNNSSNDRLDGTIEISIQ